MTAPTGSATVVNQNEAGTGNTEPRSLAWLAVAVALASPLLSQSPVTTGHTSGGNVRITVEEWNPEQAILLAISDLHDRLIAQSSDLPPEAARVLYANLWELYED